MSTIGVTDPPTEHRVIARIWARSAALRAGIIAGVVAGAIVAGVGGRTAMRIVALLDDSAHGVRTDFGATAGDVTLGGTFTLIVLMTLAGVVGGVFYIAIRRWLPWHGIARASAFGLVITFGPGVIAIGEIDLQIFEPAVPILLMFMAVEFAFGVAVALIADRLHAAPPVLPGSRAEIAARVVAAAAALGMCALAFGIVGNTIDNAGSCVTAAEGGGCALRAEP